MTKFPLSGFCLNLLFSGFLWISGCTNQPALEPTRLRCELKSDPEGISTALPRLGWQCLTTQNQASQTAYQVLVASSHKLLKEKQADLWNSGKVPGSDAAWIQYEGAPLQSRSVAYWKIRVWDQEDVPSRWSEAAHFSVGLLESDDWMCDYIGMKSNDG
ncbi:MAG: alpha-rhamnosidase, partial [Bacteroidales bacterium]|nr:alpha-rhamnosidase [Bacteroidales bacterium]